VTGHYTPEFTVLWWSVLYFTGTDSELLGSPQCHSVVWSCL